MYERGRNCNITQWTGEQNIDGIKCRGGELTRLGGSEQDDLHAPFSQTIHDGFVAQHELEELLASFGHVEQRALLRVEVRDIEDEVGQMREGERVCAIV